MNILAIESSCDETSIAIMKDQKILANIISSQIDTHKKYGGVIPEIASRLHFENFGFVLEEAMTKANMKYEELDYIAYTSNPGLIGCLHIGKMIAKTMASYLNIPLIPCNHIEGHIYASAIDEEFIFPALFLVTSGGHTQLVLLKKHLSFEILGTTLDDAVGESFDKVGRMLGFAYPAGPIIDKNWAKGKDTFHLPLPKNDKTLDFSFSGLKSACANQIDKNKNNPDFNKIDFSTSFQNVAIKILMNKLELAIDKYHPNLVGIAGGVSANSLLRSETKRICQKHHLKCIIPKMAYCTDNAAMIARLAYQKIIEMKGNN